MRHTGVRVFWQKRPAAKPLIPGPISTSCFALTTDGLETALGCRCMLPRGRIEGGLLPHYRSDGPNGAPRFSLCAPYGSKAKPPVFHWLAALLRSRSALLSVRPKSVAQSTNTLSSTRKTCSPNGAHSLASRARRLTGVTCIACYGWHRSGPHRSLLILH